MRSFLLLTACCFGIYIAKAEERPLFSWNPALLRSKPVPKGNFQQTVIPFKRASKLILVEARVDDLIGFFILDTGAPYLVLNQTYFRNFKLDPQSLVAGLDGKQRLMRTTTVNRLQIRELYYEDVEADVFDLSTIEDKRGLKILGLLGLNLFEELELEFDLVNANLKVHRLDRKGRRLAKAIIDPLPNWEWNFQLRNQVIALEGRIGQDAFLFCFDTGAETTVLDQSLPSRVLDLLQLESEAELVGAGGSAGMTRYGRLAQLDVGCPVKGARVVLADLEGLRRLYRVRIEGIIGYDLLRQGRLSINFKTQKIALWQS